MDELIEENMGLVVSIVQSFHPKCDAEREELISIGRIALWKALERYDKSKGTQISTYVWRPIKWAIQRELKRRKRYEQLNIDVERKKDNEPFWEYYPSNITEEEKQLIELRRSGYKFHEICAIVKQSPSKVKHKFYKLLVRIRESNNA